MRFVVVTLALSFALSSVAYADDELAVRIATEANCSQASKALDAIQTNEFKNIGTVEDVMKTAKAGLVQARACKDADGRTYLVGMLQSELGAASTLTDATAGAELMRGAAGLLAKCAAHVETFGKTARRKCRQQLDRQTAILRRLPHSQLPR